MSVAIETGGDQRIKSEFDAEFDERSGQRSREGTVEPVYCSSDTCTGSAVMDQML